MSDDLSPAKLCACGLSRLLLDPHPLPPPRSPNKLWHNKLVCVCMLTHTHTHRFWSIGGQRTSDSGAKLWGWYRSRYSYLKCARGVWAGVIIWGWTAYDWVGNMFLVVRRVRNIIVILRTPLLCDCNWFNHDLCLFCIQIWKQKSIKVLTIYH